MTGEEPERTIMGLLADPIVHGLVQRALARYQDGDHSAVDDSGPGDEGGGSHH